MANTRVLRRRMKSVKNISQITKAMEMVAATKMRKAQNQALSGRPYSQTLNLALSQVTSNIDPTLHKFLQPNGAKQIGVLVLTTDKSLCGALNTNVFRTIQAFSAEHKDLVFFTVGRKGRDFIVKTGKTLEADFENLEIVTFQEAVQIGKLLIDKFLAKELGEVFMIYPNFVSTLRQEPGVVKLLPISAEELRSVILSASERSQDKKSTHHSSGGRDSSPSSQNDNSEFIFEPDLMTLLDFVLKHFIESKIYQSILETKASEHSSRMVAMQNATENAKELVEDLTLTYNQTRQDAITNELLEITTAQAALE